MKKLRICSSEFLPIEKDRSYDYIYFCYDTLKIYVGKNFLSDPYCVVDILPSSAEKPVNDMLYFTLGGDVMTYRDYVWTIIAQIEDPSELVHLEKVGTMFFMKSEYRYIDKQTKRLTLPFQNGSYQLSVALNKEIKIDNQTVIIYNEETGEWEIDGGRYYDQFGRNPEIMKYHGVETKSAITTIQDDHLTVDVKISNNIGNTIELKESGLYINKSNYADKAELTTLQSSYDAFKSIINKYMSEITDLLSQLDITLNDKSLDDKIMEVLEEYKPVIVDVIDDYNRIYEDTKRFKNEMREKVSVDVENAKKEITDSIASMENTWGYFCDKFNVTSIPGTNSGTTVLTPDITPSASNKVFGYKIGTDYVYHRQDVNDYTKFVSGDEVTIPNGSDITVVYGTDNGTGITVYACAYCIVNSKL